MRVAGRRLARDEMGRAGLDAYETRFRVERMLDETESLYREQLDATAVPAAVLAKGNGRPRLT